MLPFPRKSRPRTRGQAIIEYILLVAMLAVTMAVVIRGMSRTIYGIWSGLARQVAKPCATCDAPPAPNLPR